MIRCLLLCSCLSLYVFSLGQNKIGVNVNVPENVLHVHNPLTNPPPIAIPHPAFLQISNVSTGSSASDGLLLGVGNLGQGLFELQESTTMSFKTGGVLNLNLAPDGAIAMYAGNPQPVMSVLPEEQIGIGTSDPDSSAILHVDADNKGVLLPRVTTSARNAIINPSIGLLVFDTDKQCLYMFDGVVWRPIAYLSDENALPLLERSGDPFGDDFGWTVAADNGIAVIGAPDYWGGVAYVFAKNGGSWTQEQLLVPTTPITSLLEVNYGWSVAIQGNHIIVGCVGDEAVYVFEFDGSAWVETQKIVSPQYPAKIYFGYSVAIDSNVLAVGAPRDTVFGNAQEGSVYLYEKSAGTWNQTQNLYQPSGGFAPFDWFGFSVDLDLPHLIVGIPLHGVDDGGAADIFVRNSSSSWPLLEQKAVSVADNWQGYAVAISDSIAIVGKPGFSNGRGSITKYSFSPATGMYDGPATSFSATGVPDFSYRGTSVAVEGEIYAFGQPNENGFGGSSYGEQKVRVFGNGPPVEITQFETGSGFSKSIALDGFDLIVGHPELDRFFVRNVE